MIDLEDRLRDHLAHEARQIEVPEGSLPVGERSSFWTGLAAVPVAATLVVVALLGFALFTNGGDPALDGPVASIAQDEAPAPAEAPVEPVESVEGRGVAFSPDGTGMISAVAGDSPGCEGFAAETWRLANLRDGQTTPVGDGSVTGKAVLFGNRVLIVDQCEGVVASIQTGRFTQEGDFVMEGDSVHIGEDLARSTLGPDRVDQKLMMVTQDSIARLDPATGEFDEAVPSPFPVQPTSVAAVGEYLVGATYQEQLEVRVYHRSGELTTYLSDCSMVSSDLVGEEALASGACGIYVIDASGSPHLFFEGEVLTAEPLPATDSVLAFTLSDDGSAGDWQLITPDGETHPIPGSHQTPKVVVSQDGDLLAVPDATGDETRIVTTESVMA